MSTPQDAKARKGWMDGLRRMVSGKKKDVVEEPAARGTIPVDPGSVGASDDVFVREACLHWGQVVNFTTGQRCWIG